MPTNTAPIDPGPLPINTPACLRFVLLKASGDSNEQANASDPIVRLQIAQVTLDGPVVFDKTARWSEINAAMLGASEKPPVEGIFQGLGDGAASGQYTDISGVFDDETSSHLIEGMNQAFSSPDSE